MTAPTGNSLGKREYTYDAFGRIRTAGDGAGRTTTYEYDHDDRTTQVSYSDGTAAVQFEYDGAGNMIQRGNGWLDDGFVYDRLNRLVQRGEEYSAYQYTYDPVGNLTKLHGDWRGDTEYTYNNRNLLTSMTVDEDTEYTFGYDDEGRRTSTKLAGTWGAPETVASTSNTYDNSGRLTRTTTKRWQKVNGADQESVVYDASYCYAKRVGTSLCSTAKIDDTGLRQWQTDHHRGGAVQVYTYDKGNRLTKATNLASGTYDYAYDSNGNRTSVKVNGTTTQTLTFNSANQITTSGYTYDGAGNQTGGSGTVDATYNAAGQTSENTFDGAERWFDYRGSDQAELDSTGVYNTSAGSTYFAWGRDDQHGMPMLDEYHTANYNDHFVDRDEDGVAVGIRVYTKKNNTRASYFAVLDGLGSVVGVVKDDGSLAGTYTYDPYGRTTATVANDPMINELAIGYAGGLRHGPLVKFGKRWYDTNTGRFTQQDSLNVIGEPDSGNRYAYAGDNPVNYTDPTGLYSWDDWDDDLATVGTMGGIGGIVGGSIGSFVGGVGAGPGALIGGALGLAIGFGIVQVRRGWI